jgi:hypothetical protein
MSSIIGAAVRAITKPEMTKNKGTTAQHELKMLKVLFEKSK